MFSPKTAAYSAMGNFQAITENLCGIIDSKIQFIEYRTNEIIHMMLGDEQVIVGEHKSDSDSSWMPSQNMTPNLNEFLFREIETSSHNISQLLAFRAALSEENAMEILDLLTDDKYKTMNLDAFKVISEL